MKTLILIVCICLSDLGVAQTIHAQKQIANSSATPTNSVGSRQQDGLNGQVRRLRVETVTLLVKDGKTVEGPRVVRGITTYDLRGQKIDSVAYPADESTVVGNKQQYLYDANGNIIEMIMRADDGSILNKVKYDYEFDEFGNWKKMTASIVVYENGNIAYEPFEITNRTITYYYGQPPPKTIAASTSPAVSNTNTIVSVTGPAEISKRKSHKSAKAAPARIPPSDMHASTAADALVKDPEKSAASITPPAPVTPKDEQLPTSNQGFSDLKILHPGDSLETHPEPAVAPLDRAVSFYQKGLGFLASGHNSEAVEALKEATNLDPKNASAYAKLGIAYAAAEQYQEAITVLKMAIRIKPAVVDAEAYYRLSRAYSALGKFGDALIAIKQGIYIKRAEQANLETTNFVAFPSLADLHYSAGLTYSKMRRYREAIKELKQVVALNPKLAQAYYGLALSYIAIGDQKSAQKQQETLETLDPDYAAQIAKSLSTNANTAPQDGFIYKKNPVVRQP